jgi:hypothetical protein
MVMAATSGNVTSNKFGFVPNTALYGSTSGYQFSFGGIVHNQPVNWRESVNRRGYDVSMRVWIADDSGTGLRDVQVSTTINDAECQLNVIGPTTDAYKHAWYTSSTNGNVSGVQQPDLGDSATTVKAQYGISESFSSASVELRMMYLESDNSVEPTEDFFEVTGIHDPSGLTNAWTPFDENETCSAFAMKTLVCHNTNRVTKETKPAYTIPLFDDNTTTL